MIEFLCQQSSSPLVLLGRSGKGSWRDMLSFPISSLDTMGVLFLSNPIEEWTLNTNRHSKCNGIHSNGESSLYGNSAAIAEACRSEWSWGSKPGEIFPLWRHSHTVVRQTRVSALRQELAGGSSLVFSSSSTNVTGIDRDTPKQRWEATFVSDDGGRQCETKRWWQAFWKNGFSKKCSYPQLAATETCRSNVLRRLYGALSFFDVGGGCSMSSDDSKGPNNGGKQARKNNFRCLLSTVSHLSLVINFRRR
nr:hypothetical protein Iba_chr10aCG13800 [Ipomoea batatas]GMD44013.1 hypothetical protein Iba_chr10cCG10850 [Ipomoea batatas]